VIGKLFNSCPARGSVLYSTLSISWILAVDSTIAHLASHPSSRPDLTFLAEFNHTQTINESQHLACFAGGNFLLGGSVLRRQDYINFGLAITDGCHDTYASTLTKIGPESFSWDTTSIPANQTAFYAANGFWIRNGQYILRPEVIESYYYAYQITHDPKYQDWAWDAFVAINATTRTGSGFTEINDVNAPGGGGFRNFQDSFLFAEVMKYSYLIQAPVSILAVLTIALLHRSANCKVQQRPWDVNFNGCNEWVFNTEAHPLRVRRQQSGYGHAGQCYNHGF